MGSSYFGEPNFGNERGSSTTGSGVGGGGGGGGSSSSSSRKGKKSSSEKPKQPQRGLGVAQLEKIRLTGQMCHPSSLQTPPYSTNFNNDEIRAQTANYSSIPSSSFSYTSTSSSSSLPYGFNTNTMMGLGDYERTNIRYGDSQPTITPRWDPSNAYIEAQHYVQPNMTRHLLNLHVEDSEHMNGKKNRSNSRGSSSQNSESSDTQELDLELRLSL